jgi:hypothetical protein
MKYLLVTSILLLMACGKDQQGCNPSSGQTQYNGNTVELIDGTCTMTSEPAWQNPAYSEYLICNTRFTVLNGIVCEIDPEGITSQTTGCTPMSDGDVVFPNNSSTPTEQCWFNITNGKINDTTPPTF